MKKNKVDISYHFREKYKTDLHFENIHLRISTSPKNQRKEKEWNRKVIISRHTLCLSFEYPIFLDAAAFTDRIWRVGSRFFTVS